MCLESVIKTTTFKKKYGYKVFSFHYDKLYSVYQGNNKPIKINKRLLCSSYDSFPKEIHLRTHSTTGRNIYKKGWHSCETIKDAKEWRNIHASPFARIYRVLISGKTTIGESPETDIKNPTFVSTYITLLKEIK